MAAVLTDILDALVTQTKAIALDGIDDKNIRRFKVPLSREQDMPGLPAVLISPFGAPRINASEGTNASDYVWYPVLIATICASNQDQTENFDRHCQWLESIRKKFIHQRITGGPTSVCTINIDLRDTFDAAAFLKNYDAGGMIIRVLSKESRG